MDTEATNIWKRDFFFFEENQKRMVLAVTKAEQLKDTNDPLCNLINTGKNIGSTYLSSECT